MYIVRSATQLLFDPGIVLVMMSPIGQGTLARFI